MGLGDKFGAMAAHQHPTGAATTSTTTHRPSAPPAPAANSFHDPFATSGATHPGSAPPDRSAGGRAVLQRQIRAKFDQAVAWRQLQQLYPPYRLDRLAESVAEKVDFVLLAQQWQLPYEVALDLCTLALYDIIIYADDSGSMRGSSWDRDLMAIVQRTAAVATLFDDDGISVRFMNCRYDEDFIKTERDVMQLLKKAQPCGGTPLGTSMKAKILDPYLDLLRRQRNQLTELKPLLIITVTDGAPSMERPDTVLQVIRSTRQALQSLKLHGKEVAYQFAQVGNDRDATEFLDQLDNHPEIGPFVDATSNFEEEAQQWWLRSNGASVMTQDLYLLKLLCGATDDEWDAKDEGPQSMPGAGNTQPAGHCVCQ